MPKRENSITWISLREKTSTLPQKKKKKKKFVKRIKSHRLGEKSLQSTCPIKDLYLKYTKNFLKLNPKKRNKPIYKWAKVLNR